MRILSEEDFKRLVLRWVQPLMRGSVTTLKGFKATLEKVIPFGGADNYLMTFPFGFVSLPTPKALAYFFNLYGKAEAPVIVGFDDTQKPTPNGPGASIIYCRSQDGTTIPINIHLRNDGTLVIMATAKVQIQAPAIEVGAEALEYILNGETFQTTFNNHTHVDSVGGETETPESTGTQSTASDLSAVVKAAKT